MTTRPPVAISSRGCQYSIARPAFLVVPLLLAIQARALFQEPAKVDSQPTSCTSEGYLRITLFGMGKQSKTPVSAILTDPQGRKLGYEPVGKIEYEDVPQATLTRDREQPKVIRRVSSETGELEPLPKTPAAPPPPSQMVLEICNPIGGQYQLQIMGTQQGKYGATINAANREIVDSSGKLFALESRAEIPPTNTHRGTIQNFLMVYSRTPAVKVRVKAASTQ